MALHPEINPNPEGLPLSIAAAALRAARSSKTSHSGSAYFETGSTADGDGVGIVTGPIAAEHGGIGRLDDEGVLRPLVDLEPLEQAAQAAQAQADSVREQAERDAQTLREQMSKVAADADKASEQAHELAQSALDAANKADGKADTITTTVNGHESKLTELSASLESTRETADGALDKSTKVEASVGALSATLTRNYTPTSKADAKYAAKTELNQTADEIKSTVAEQGSTLDGAVHTISQVSQKADSISSTLQQVQGNLNLISNGLYNNVLNGGFEDSANGWTIQSMATIVSDQHHTGFKALKWNIKTGDISNNHEFDVSVGRTYQWSAWIKGEQEANITIYPKLIVWNGSAWDTDDCQKVESIVLKTEWTKYTYTFTVASGYSKAMFGMGAGSIQTVFYVDDCALVDITDVKTATDTANSALSQASRVEQTLDSFKTSVSQTYQPKGDYATNSSVAAHYATQSSLDQTAQNITTSVAQTYQPKGDYATNSALSSYATKTQLEQTANSITSSVSATAKTAQSALDKASTVEQTASGLSSRISEVASTASGAVTTANEAKSTADKNTATISQVSKTAQGALDKASSVEQSLDGFKATVSQTYTTRDATLLRYKITGAEGAPAWLHLGDWNNSSDANSCEIVFYTGDGYNGRSDQNSTAHIFIKNGWQSTASTTKAFGVTVTLDNANESTLQVLVLASSHNACSVWAHPAWGYWNGLYTVVCSGGSWTHTGEHQSDKPTGAEQELEYRPNAGANAQAILGIRSDLDTQYTKKSEFDVTVDGFESRISTTESRIDATSQSVVNEIHDRQRYMRFSDSTGKPTLELGASDSSNKMVLTNDRLEFRVNDNAVAYLGNDRMNINNAEIKNVLVLGKYAFMPRDNGNISLQYIG